MASIYERDAGSGSVGTNTLSTEAGSTTQPGQVERQGMLNLSTQAPERRLSPQARQWIAEARERRNR